MRIWPVIFGATESSSHIVLATICHVSAQCRNKFGRRRNVSTLEITVTHHKDFWEAARHLKSAGISVEISPRSKSNSARNHEWLMRSQGLDSFHAFKPA